jgi:hypothetical protein
MKLGPIAFERDFNLKLEKYTIVYSSPYYWLYNEETNELIMKDPNEEKVKAKKKELESEKDE